MGKSNTVRNTSSLYLLLGLVTLLLFSPCKVRNAVEIALGANTTSVSNKSQTTAQHQLCASYERTPVSATAQLPVHGKIPNLYGGALFKTLHSSKHKMQWHKQLFVHREITIPYYILYQNFKVYA
ncbi:MAG: hypothetical protein GYB39_05610 [Algicola sp.]|nr:hypothetical protein [Algicola sp.]